MLALAAALALSAAAAPSCGLPDAGPARAWTAGERLSYDVSAMGVRRGEGCVLTVSPAATPGAPVELAAECTFRAPFLSFHGTARSSLDAATLRARRFHDEWNDGTPRSTDADLARGGLAVRVFWTSGARRNMNAFVRGGAVLDLLSTIHYLRAAELAPGSAFCLDVVGGGHYWRLAGRAAGGPERLRTPAGTFQAVRLEGTAVQADDAGTRYPLRLWLSADARRLPLALEAGSGVGAARAVLASASPGAGP